MIDASVTVKFLTWTADKLLGLRIQDKEESEKARNRISSYLLEIADCMSAIAENLRGGKIPREHGHCLSFLARGFSITLASNLNSSMELSGTPNDWAYLIERAALDADNADGLILKGDLEIPKTNLEDLIANIERTAGEFRGLSIQTKAIGTVSTESA